MLFAFTAAPCAKSFGSPLLAGLLFIFCTPLWAEEPAALRQVVQGVFAFEARHGQGLDDVSDAQMLSVYIGSDTDTLLVQSARLTVDGGASTQIDIGGRAARALHAGGMLRLQLRHGLTNHGADQVSAKAVTNNPPQAPIHVEVVARRNDGAMSAMLVRLTYEGVYAPGADGGPLQLQLRRDGVLRRYVLQAMAGDPA